MSRWGAPKPTRVDFENRLMTRLCNLSGERLATITPAELSQSTGCDVRLCEARLNARRDRVARLARGEVTW